MEHLISSESQFLSSAGRWATEQMVRHGVSPHALRPCSDAKDPRMRAGALLSRDSWIHFDNVAVKAAQERLVAVADLIEAGLTVPLPNAMGRTVINYQKVTDMTPAQVSMDPSARTITSRLEYSPANVPNPVIHKDFDIGIRELKAHEDRGEPLDTSHIEAAGRMVAEAMEDLVLNGGPTFAGMPIYGYTTHPNRNTASFGAGGAWDQAAKTGDQIIADVVTMITGLATDNRHGPFVLYLSGTFGPKLIQDYKAASDKTIIGRILEIPQISKIRYADRLSGAALMVQLSSDVVQLYDGLGISTVQWDLDGGMKVAFKVMAIQTPVVKADANNGSGIFHMA